jgi:hypothetical protein
MSKREHIKQCALQCDIVQQPFFSLLETFGSVGQSQASKRVCHEDMKKNKEAKHIVNHAQEGMGHCNKAAGQGDREERAIWEVEDGQDSTGQIDLHHCCHTLASATPSKHRNTQPVVLFDVPVTGRWQEDACKFHQSSSSCVLTIRYNCVRNCMQTTRCSCAHFSSFTQDVE